MHKKINVYITCLITNRSLTFTTKELNVLLGHENKVNETSRRNIAKLASSYNSVLK